VIEERYVGTFSQGLSISFYGILITFIALTVVILLIRLLLLLFPAKTDTEPAFSRPPEEDPNLPHVVAFAAAWWLKQKSGNLSLGERLEDSPGKWWNKSKE
jgi:hypothetical protein